MSIEDDPANGENECALDIVWSDGNDLIGKPSESTLLLHIDAGDASNLDIAGASGAIGRIEVENDGGKYGYNILLTVNVVHHQFCLSSIIFVKSF